MIGSDEVGWGPVAGSLYVVGVAMPGRWSFPGLLDSKDLTRKAREAMFWPLIDAVQGNWALAIRTPAQIDRLGAMPCLIDAHTSVLTQLISRTPRAELDRVIVDGNLRLPKVPYAVAIPKAETHFQVVAAASVIAKVLHDDAMSELAAKYPQYGFAKNVGYETKSHLQALKRYGLCPAHRRSYLKKLLGPS